MCRYGFRTYKSHFFCFDCRKQFKQISIYEKMGRDLADRYNRLFRINEGTWQLPKYHEKYVKNQVFVLTEDEKNELDELNKRYHSGTFCPQCRQPMAELGKDVKVPKMRDKDAWEALKKTYQLGYSFQSCGCSGPGFVPQNKVQHQEFLKIKLAEYEANYKKCLKEEETNKTDPTIYIHDRSYWANIIEKVKQAISKI